MQVIKEEYGPFQVTLVPGRDNLHGEANAFAGRHNCNMDREFKAVNLDGDYETISRYDFKNAYRVFEVEYMEFSGNQYRIKRGTVLKELESISNSGRHSAEQEPVQEPAQEPIQEPQVQEEPVQEPVKSEEPEEEMPTFDMSMFESKRRPYRPGLTEGFTYNKYCESKFRGSR